ncbi:MAG: (2E,6E)-farnesyl diphosphate synthase [Gammaproteobacteria bacterium]
MNFEAHLKAHQTRAERALDRWLPAAEREPARLHEAMRYAVLGPGKRVRPVLVYATGEALGADLDRLDSSAAAVEFIHAYSLVHDDLPAMDDDDLRRGRPTCHRAYDEATAILAGDALQALAFRALAHDTRLAVPAERRLEMIALLADASGSVGMAGGQAIDLAAVGQKISLAELENMHLHKTGALIRASVQLGFMGAGGVDAEAARALDIYARSIGLAFQVHDDILDVEGATEVIGKPQGSDLDRDKPTYPNLLGMAQAKATARRLCDEAVASLAGFGAGAETLRELARYIVGRDR